MKKNLTVLIVDDTPENITMLHGVLGDEYRVLAATSGAKALQIAREKKPNLILLDVIMIDMDGYEVCRRLKADPATADIPVIFVTAKSDQQDEAFGLSIGAVDYLSKPIQPIIVQQRVRTHLELYSARRQIEQLGQRYASYLSPELSAGILSGQIAPAVNSTRKKLTIFFSDIAGFTTQTEALEPEDMTHLLNSYFEAMNDVIARHGGTLDKYIGDAIMVFFGDPQTKGLQEDAVACVRMALEMQERLQELRSDWESQGIVDPLRVRMGICTGFVTVGNYGSSHKLDYTIMGTPVNLAARIQEQAPVGSILLAEETWQLVKDHFLTVSREPISVNGISHQLKTHLVVAAETGRWINFESGVNMLRINPDRLSDAECRELHISIMNLDKRLAERL